MLILLSFCRKAKSIKEIWHDLQFEFNFFNNFMAKADVVAIII